MDHAAAAALTTDKVIDITTTGRKSGEPKRIEIWFHNIQGRCYITGRPGRRSWFANLAANPDFTFHLKEGAQADLQARARVIADEAARRATLRTIIAAIEGDFERNLDEWVVGSPLVEVEFID
jgi:deazaflavin-dependent oxidoreductase (nitroreductase family)